MSKNKTFALIAGSITLVLIAVFGFMGFKNFNVVQDKANSIISEANEIKDQNNRTKTITQEEPVFTERVNAASTVLPSEFDLPKIIDAISAAAVNNGLFWASGQPSDQITETELANETPLSITLTAPSSSAQASIQGFLKEMQSINQLVTVSSLSVSSSFETSDSATTIVVNLKVYTELESLTTDPSDDSDW